MKILQPHIGPQTMFLSTNADIAIYGGAAGGGKTFALLMEAARMINEPEYRAVIFRRTAVQIRAPGALWDTSFSIYIGIGGKPYISTTEWVFPSGAKIRFAHLQYDSDKHGWQGSQVSMLGFDELTHFNESQVSYLISRLRSPVGGSPKVRITTNPDSEHWSRKWLSWWIDENTGLAIDDLAGKIRWMKWGDDYGHWGWRDTMADGYLSMTFIPAKASDNPTMLANNPKYVTALKSLTLIDRERLLHGNWNIAPAPGLFFKAVWFGNPIPASAVLEDSKYVRYWDRASVDSSRASSSHSWTVGVKMGYSKTTRLYYVVDVVRGQWSPAEVQNRVKTTAEKDGANTTIILEEDPGQAGKFEISSYLAILAGFTVKSNKVQRSKLDRAKPFSAAVENGIVRIVSAAWNSAYLSELERFDGSDKQTNDQVDASSGAFYMLTAKRVYAW